METMNYIEAAALLKITVGTLRNWVSQGRIKPHRVGKHVLFSREELEAWITGAAVPSPVPAPAPAAVPAPQARPAEEAPPGDWDAKFQLSFSGKADGGPFAFLETMPGKSVKMTPDDMRELARYLVGAAELCEDPKYRGVKHFRMLREPLNSLSAVCLIPHDLMRDLKTLAQAAARSNDPQAGPPEKYAIRFIKEGLRSQEPVINQRLKERGNRGIRFISTS